MVVSLEMQAAEPSKAHQEASISSGVPFRENLGQISPKAGLLGKLVGIPHAAQQLGCDHRVHGEDVCFKSNIKSDSQIRYVRKRRKVHESKLKWADKVSALETRRHHNSTPATCK
ncbi:hypothetical protein CRM22_004121 [Opisthorchis felineus]|uniref:Uncharacterized protein n=1 Tax=Opisthorchis felineus TaxID=147828 RepID=A0A4S2LXT0_OPIFE|nr:hypothetical protein CRM22_004121 [Opisthorchis felineus]